MSQVPVETKIRGDGLRYVSRPAGSPVTARSIGPHVKSCLLCGQHKSPAQGRYVPILGKSQFVCLVCRPAPQPPLEEAARAKTKEAC